jgi:hypothetical protein
VPARRAAHSPRNRMDVAGVVDVLGAAPRLPDCQMRRAQVSMSQSIAWQYGQTAHRNQGLTRYISGEAKSDLDGDIRKARLRSGSAWKRARRE